jgi:hypothetical protein
MIQPKIVSLLGNWEFVIWPFASSLLETGLETDDLKVPSLRMCKGGGGELDRGSNSRKFGHITRKEMGGVVAAETFTSPNFIVDFSKRAEPRSESS